MFSLPKISASSPQDPFDDDDALPELGASRGSALQARVPKKTPSQEQAETLFQCLDKGVLEPSSVFGAIRSSNRRVESRLAYYRERGTLVLPPIEERYMHADHERGCMVVNIPKLLAQSRLNHGGSTRSCSPVSDAWRSCSPASDACAAQCNQELPLSVLSGSATMPGMPRQGLEPRAVRQVELARLRDHRMASAQALERDLLASRRCMQLAQLHRKGARKAVAQRERTVNTWVAAVLAMQSFARLWRIFRKAYSHQKRHACARGGGSEGGGAAEHCYDERPCGRGFWRASIQVAGTGGTLTPALRSLLADSLSRRWREEIAAGRKRVARFNWLWLLATIRCARKIILCVRRRRSAGIIKVVIGAVSPVFQLRACVHTFMRYVRLLQRSMRLSYKFRSYIRKFVYLPTLWQAETQILGLTMEVPVHILNSELEMQKKYWNLPHRLQEAKRIMAMKLPLLSAVRSEVMHDLRTDGAPSRGRRPSRSGAASSAQESRHFMVGMRAAATHPAMDSVNAYRLSAGQRDRIVSKLFRTSVNRWWEKYQDYKSHMESISLQRQKWRGVVSSLGVRKRNLWPELPEQPVFPCQLLQINSEHMEALILDELNRTHQGTSFRRQRVAPRRSVLA